MKKVLFVITKPVWGGAQKYVFDLAAGLPKDAYEPAIATGGRGYLTEKLALASIPVYEVPALQRDMSLGKEFAALLQLYRLFRRERPHVVHLNSSKAAALGALAARLASVPRIVFTVHGWPFKEDRSPLAKALMWLASYLTALLSHRVIVVSRTDEALGRRMPFVQKKLVRVPLAIHAPAFLDREAAARHFGLEGGALRIYTIAELTKNKGIRYALEAFAELGRRGIGATYVIASDGEDRVALEARAKDLGIANRVRFAGYVADAAKYLKGFDVFLLPSLKEGMPYVLLEAAAAGLPIIATSVIDDEFANESGARIVPPGDARAIADALADLVASPGLPLIRETDVHAMIDRTAALY